MRGSLFLACMALVLFGCKKDDDMPQPSGGGNGGGNGGSGDVYVSGFETPDAGRRALYWKNGTAHFLSDGSTGAAANAITAANGTVYVVGRQEDAITGQYRAVLWVNGTSSYLTPLSAPHCSANDLMVVGTDVYVCGYSRATGGNARAAVWVNGAETTLTDGTEEATAEDIFVLNGDVYVAGQEDGVAKYWLNGAPVVLGTGAGESGASGIWVANGNVYVGGYEEVGGSTESVVWVNSTLQVLSANGGVGHALFMEGSDVYVAGQYLDSELAVYWKNGVGHAPVMPTNLLTTSRMCRGIHVRDGVVHTATINVYNGNIEGYYSNNSTNTSVHLNGMVTDVWVD